MKHILTAILILLAYCSKAQVGNVDQFRIKTKLTLGDRSVTKLYNDSTFAAADSLSLPTSWAVKGFVANKLSQMTIATGKTYVVSSQSEMLALSANVGDVAVRTDSSASFILQVTPASTLSNWVLLLFPNNVPSVFGRSGNVVAQDGDYDHTQISGVDSLFALKQNNIINLGDTVLYLKKRDSSIFATVYQNNMKANNSDVVHKTGDETIAGTKTFADSLKVPTRTQADSSANAANTAWIKAQSYMKSIGKLPSGSIPFSDANGILTWDAAGLLWDGSNLRAGHDDFYSTTGLGLNGNRAYIGGSGFGMVVKTTGGRPMDGSKSIIFYNSDTEYGRFSMRTAYDSMLRFTSRMEIIPGTTNKFDIGSSSLQWNNIYAKQFYLNGTLLSPVSNEQINLWTNKQDQLNGTGFVKANGSTITYDNSTYATQLALNDTASALRAIAGSGGDMFKSVYDPTNISGDAFNYNNLYNTPNLTLKLNISDTSTMLSKYLRKVDTTGKWLSASYTPSWGNITGKPTTLSGYGITDAVNTTGTQTVAGTKTFSASMIYFNNIHGLNRVSLGNGTFESFSLFSDPTNSIFGIGANAYHDPTTNTYIVPIKFAYGGHGATIEASPTTGIRAMSVDSNGVATRLISVDTSGTLNLPKLKSGVSGQDFLRIDVNNDVFRNTQSEVITHLGISAKMNYTDTSAMLSPLWNKINSQTTDTVTANTPLHIVLNQSTNKQTLYVDTASATKDGALLKEDWSTFNGKQNQILLTTNGTSGAATLTGSTLNIPQYSGGTGGVTNLALGTATTTTQLITNSNGTGFTLTAATTLKAGLLSSDTQTIAGNKIFNGSVTLKSAADDGAALDKILQVDPTGIIKSNTFSDFQYKIGVNDRPKFTDSVTAIQTGTMTPTMLASLNGKQDKLIAITNQSNNYTLALSDANGMLREGSSAATTVTVPTNATVAYPIGTQINIMQASTAQVTIAGAAGVTINSADGKKKTRVQFSTVTLVKMATDTWLLFGDISN